MLDSSLKSCMCSWARASGTSANISLTVLSRLRCCCRFYLSVPLHRSRCRLSRSVRFTAGTRSLLPCRWEAGSWSQCSATCGEGIQQRTVLCAAENGDCASPAPSSQQTCDTGSPCPQWQSAPWSQVVNSVTLCQCCIRLASCMIVRNGAA